MRKEASDLNAGLRSADIAVSSIRAIKRKDDADALDIHGVAPDDMLGLATTLQVRFRGTGTDEAR